MLYHQQIHSYWWEEIMVHSNRYQLVRMRLLAKSLWPQSGWAYLFPWIWATFIELHIERLGQVANVTDSPPVEACELARLRRLFSSSIIPRSIVSRPKSAAVLTQASFSVEAEVTQDLPPAMLTSVSKNISGLGPVRHRISTRETLKTLAWSIYYYRLAQRMQKA